MSPGTLSGEVKSGGKQTGNCSLRASLPPSAFARYLECCRGIYPTTSSPFRDKKNAPSPSLPCLYRQNQNSGTVSRCLQPEAGPPRTQRRSGAGLLQLSLPRFRSDRQQSLRPPAAKGRAGARFLAAALGRGAACCFQSPENERSAVQIYF